MSDALAGLQRWYQAQCDGVWEHEFGIRLTSLDQPGFQLLIDLTDTDLAGRPFTLVTLERDPQDWLHAWRDAYVFKATCGALNLEELLMLFVDWAQAPASEAAP